MPLGRSPPNEFSAAVPADYSLLGRLRGTWTQHLRISVTASKRRARLATSQIAGAAARSPAVGDPSRLQSHALWLIREDRE